MAQKLLLDLHIVFDDAVVHQRDSPVLADMGVCVDVIGLAMGSPAGMADAEGPLHIRAAVNHVRQHLKPPLGLINLQALFPGPHRHAGGVIAPVLHPGQALQQNGRRLLLAHIADNTTHK